MLVLSLFFGIFAALVAPFILESVDNKIKTADDVEAILNLPVISSFSEVAADKKDNITTPGLS
jgi:capsular polysaccharide biosynthesis protein